MVSPAGGRPVSPPHSTTSSASNWAGTHWSTLDPRVSLCLFPIRKSSSAFQSIEREIRLDRKPIGYVYSYAASGKWIKTSNCWRAPMHTRFVEEDSSMFYLLSGRFHKRRWSEIVDGQSAGEQQAEYSLRIIPCSKWRRCEFYFIRFDPKSSKVTHVLGIIYCSRWLRQVFIL